MNCPPQVSAIYLFSAFSQRKDNVFVHTSSVCLSVNHSSSLRFFETVFGLKDVFQARDQNDERFLELVGSLAGNSQKTAFFGENKPFFFKFILTVISQIYFDRSFQIYFDRSFRIYFDRFFPNLF